MNRRNPLWLGLVGMLWGGTWMEIGDVLWVAGHQFAAILAGGVLAVGAYLIGWYGTERRRRMPDPVRIDSRYRPDTSADAPDAPWPDERWWEIALTGFVAALGLFLLLAVAIAGCVGLLIALDWGLRWLR